MRVRIAFLAAAATGLMALGQSAVAGEVTGTLGVSVNVLGVESCVIEHGLAGGINRSFDPNTTVEDQTTVGVTCTAGSNWALSYDQGLNPGAGSSCAQPLRRATNGESTLRYDLFVDQARTQLLGCDGTNSLTGVGTGVKQYSWVYYLIPEGQSATPGTHTDTVVATLTF